MTPSRKRPALTYVTQLRMSEAHRDALAAIASATDQSVSELLREAIEHLAAEYVNGSKTLWDAALEGELEHFQVRLADQPHLRD
jgi:predicted transcriptional regulator